MATVPAATSKVHSSAGQKELQADVISLFNASAVKMGGTPFTELQAAKPKNAGFREFRVPC